MLGAGLIDIIIAIVIGVSVIPTIMETPEETVPAGEEPSAGVSALVNILPF